MAVVLGDGTRIEGFSVSAPGGTAIWCEEGRGIIRDNELAGSVDGVVAGRSSRVEISGNHISANSGVGIESFGKAAPLSRRNVIQGNGAGVAAHGSASPDLGRGSDPGMNQLSGNTDCDVANDTDSLLFAVGNTWNQPIESITPSAVCSGGAPVANTGAGAGAYRSAPATDTPLFSGAARVPTLLPGPGEVVASTTPRFAWEATGDGYVAIGVFAGEVQVRGREIANPEALVWAWYTGLPTGREGDVAFKDGRAVRDGVLSSTEPAAPLERGRTYSWAVWSWNGDPPRIAHSSALVLFGVSN